MTMKSANELKVGDLIEIETDSSLYVFGACLDHQNGIIRQVGQQFSRNSPKPVDSRGHAHPLAAWEGPHRFLVVSAKKDANGMHQDVVIEQFGDAGRRVGFRAEGVADKTTSHPLPVVREVNVIDRIQMR